MIAFKIYFIKIESNRSRFNFGHLRYLDLSSTKRQIEEYKTEEAIANYKKNIGKIKLDIDRINTSYFKVKSLVPKNPGKIEIYGFNKSERKLIETFVNEINLKDLFTGGIYSNGNYDGFLKWLIDDVMLKMNYTGVEFVF